MRVFGSRCSAAWASCVGFHNNDKFSSIKLSSNIHRSFWTVVDQAVVSAGTFLVNVLLARHLPAANYGIFSLLYSGLLALQLFNATLLIYPFSIRLVTATDRDHAHLLATTVVLVGLSTTALSVILGVFLVALGQDHLVGSALSCFAFWQMQEAMRRGLFTRFRHRAAALGDAVSYLGQVIVVAGLLALQSLTIESALYAMAATSAAAAVFQFLQLDFRTDRRLDLRQGVLDCRSGGGVQALGTGLLALGRFAIFPWALAIASGPAAAAAFQAAANIINVANPIMIGLGNVVPQAAAEAVAGGNNRSWRVVRGYLTLAAPIVTGYLIIIAIIPTMVLRLLYGLHSSYLALGTPVRLLIVASLLSCGCEFIIWFLHGVKLVRSALIINIVGFLASVVLLLALFKHVGVTGCCIVLLIASAVRLVFAANVLSGILKAEGQEETRNRVRAGH